MRNYTLENFSGSVAEFLNLPSARPIPWRRITVDAVVIVLFILTSSWFVRG